jgi:putative colanic acid biosynthesis acetyltransferase WcaF
MTEHSQSFLLDPVANHAARKYSRSEQVRRVFWSLGCWLITLSPLPLFGWRRGVLRLFGAKVGPDVKVHPSTQIEMPWNVEIGDGSVLGERVFIYSLGKVTLGRNVTLSYRSHVCAGTHDFSDPAVPLLKPPVVLEDGVCIGMEAFVGPGVTVRAGAIVGARSVVVKDIEPLAVVAGNPARPLPAATTDPGHPAS